MPSRFTYSKRDFDNETSSTTFEGDVVNAANFDATQTKLDTLAGAIDAVTMGETSNDVRTSLFTIQTTIPTNQWAQREIKWLVVGYDAIEKKKWRVEIPTADLSLLDNTSEDPNVRRSLDLSSGPGLALKDAIEAYHKPYGNDVTVQSVTMVGRNL